MKKIIVFSLSIMIGGINADAAVDCYDISRLTGTMVEIKQHKLLPENLRKDINANIDMLQAFEVFGLKLCRESLDDIINYCDVCSEENIGVSSTTAQDIVQLMDEIYTRREIQSSKRVPEYAVKYLKEIINSNMMVLKDYYERTMALCLMSLDNVKTYCKEYDEGKELEKISELSCQVSNVQRAIDNNLIFYKDKLGRYNMDNICNISYESNKNLFNLAVDKVKQVWNRCRELIISISDRILYYESRDTNQSKSINDNTKDNLIKYTDVSRDDKNKSDASSNTEIDLNKLKKDNNDTNFSVSNNDSRQLNNDMEENDQQKNDNNEGHDNTKDNLIKQSDVNEDNKDDNNIDTQNCVNELWNDNDEDCDNTKDNSMKQSDVSKDDKNKSDVSSSIEIDSNEVKNNNDIETKNWVNELLQIKQVFEQFVEALKSRNGFNIRIKQKKQYPRVIENINRIIRELSSISDTKNIVVLRRIFEEEFMQAIILADRIELDDLLDNKRSIHKFNQSTEDLIKNFFETTEGVTTNDLVCKIGQRKKLFIKAAQALIAYFEDHINIETFEVSIDAKEVANILKSYGYDVTSVSNTKT